MGLYSSKELSNGAEIHIWEITESEEELRKLCAPIPSDEIEELLLLNSETRRKEKLAIRALLKQIFETKVYLGHHDNGKPYIINSVVELSITHTSRFVAIITHPNSDVGIDMESVERNFSAVYKKALSEKERKQIGSNNQDLKLAIIWCAKEAVYKRMSIIGVDFASQILIHKFNPKNEGEIDAVFVHRNGKEEHLELRYELIENHVMVWIVDN